jgi:NAD(P)H dehydrogenase (quinone)
MGKVLIIYDSETGNTEKMAHLVAEGAKKVSRRGSIEKGR